MLEHKVGLIYKRKDNNDSKLKLIDVFIPDFNKNGDTSKWGVFELINNDRFKASLGSIEEVVRQFDPESSLDNLIVKDISRLLKTPDTENKKYNWGFLTNFELSMVKNTNLAKKLHPKAEEYIDEDGISWLVV